jgi:hypothetical protein
VEGGRAAAIVPYGRPDKVAVVAGCIVVLALLAAFTVIGRVVVAAWLFGL